MEDKHVKLGLYKHFKGDTYEVIAVARYSEDPEVMYVVYRGLYFSTKFGNNPIWVRPLDNFLEKKVIDGVEVDKFEFIEEIL